MTIQFAQNYFVEEYDPTIEDTYRKQVTIDKDACILEILDTIGHRDYDPMFDLYLRAGQGFICTYSLTSRSSFDEINRFRDRILQIKDEYKVPMILVGNKCDLESSRTVTATEGQELAKSFGCHFFETSAKDKINVEESFYQLVREVRQYNEVKNEFHRKKGLSCSLM